MFWAFLFAPNQVSAADGDGSAHLDLVMTPSVSSTGVVAGRNFTYNVNLSNTASSEWDAFKYGYILQLPTSVSFVSSDLWSPDRTVNHNSWSTLLFFRTNLPLTKGMSKSNSFTLTTTSGAIGTSKDIKILWYANDNIYGVGKPPVWAPMGTLTGAVDFANSAYYTGSTTFPDNIIATSNLSTLPFTGASVGVIPFDITKSESSSSLVWDEVTTNITITNNNLGPLNDVNIQDIIPKNRKFVSFTSTWWVGWINITYDSPTAWETKIDFTNIDVPTGNTLTISYKTLLLSHDLLTNSGSIEFNTGSFINNGQASINQAIPHTGGLVGTGANQTYWNNGVSNIAVNASTLPSTKTATIHTSFANISKSVDKSLSSIGEILTYTLDIDVSDEFDLESSGDNTYIDDVIPDGMTFSGMISSTIITGSGTAFSLSWSDVDANGDTTVRWKLPSGVITAGSKARIVYQTLLDGAFEWTGPNHYVNNDTLTNTATLTYQVWGNTSGDWWFTESTLLWQIYTDSASASTRAPTPTMNKQLISAIVPGGGTYNNSNPLTGGTRLTVGTELTFAISADFPNVYFTGIKLKDALPLLSGPNDDVYDIAFQTNPGLLDMYGSAVDINDNDGNGFADTSFNGKTLSGTTSVGNNSWLSTSSPNYINFDLGSGNGWNKFSILFTVKILPTAPEAIDPDGLHPLLNVATWEYRNAWGTLYADLLKEVPFTIALPALNVTKTASGSNIAYGNQVDYTVTLTNSGAAPAYAENILDVIPANMDLDTWSIVYSGSVSNIPNSNITQNGTGLTIEVGTGTLGSSRSLIPVDNFGWVTSEKENIVVIKYTLKPNVNFIVWYPTTRTNTVTLDYYSTHNVPSLEVNNYGPITASASFTTSTPTITRSLFSTSETDSTSNNLYIWEEVTFDTTIYLSWGTYLTGYYDDTVDTNLQYLSWEILSYSGNLNFNTWATFSSTGRIVFGTIVNDDATPSTKEAITLRTTYRLKNTVSDANLNTNKSTTGKFWYNTTSITSSASNVVYRKPTITIVKSATGTLVDASDIVTYTIKVTNTNANAHGYDYTLTDVMPSGVDYIPGSLSWNVVFSGSETDFFSGSGIIIDALAPSASGSIWYNAIISTGSIAGQTKNNVVNISYSSLDDDGSAYEKTYTGTSNVSITIKDISISHTLSGTDLADTATSKFNGSYSDVAIGEEVTYKINVNLSELNYSGTTVTQTLPTGLKFTTGSIVVDNVIWHSLSTITLSGNTQIIFNFWDIENLGWVGTGFILETKAVLLDNGGNTAGNVKNSVVRIDYNSSNFKTNNTPNFDIVEPSLTIVKDYSPNSWDGGDTIPTTITVSNVGTAPAYDVVIDDYTPSKASTDAGYYSSTGISVILPGASVNYTYNTTLLNSVVYGEVLTGTATVNYNSYPGSPTEWERSYSGSDTDTISITGLSGLSKTLLTTDTAKIADTASYKLAFPISEWATSNIVITDKIATGTIVVPGSVVITKSSWVTYSGTVSASYDVSSDTITSGNAQTLTYTFTDIVNTDADNGITEYIYIDYDTVIANSSDNNSGDTKSSPVSADYNSGTTILNASPIALTIQEPNISLNVNKVYSSGHTVDILYTITNNGNTWAYNVTLDTLLSSGLTYSGNIILTNSGLAINLSKSGNNFTIDELPVNTGNPLTFTLKWDISESIGDNETLYVTGNLEYTSQDGTYSPLTANILDTERNGTASPIVNDYYTSWSTNFVTAYPILNESISVHKSVWAIGDKFTYTITLTNSGSINLTNIEVTHSISDSFTWFSITTLPGGATNNSNATGWVNNAGILSISGISLPIWQTTTIVYDVYAKSTVVDGTVVTTTTNVSNTPEGAIWWTPSVPVTIYAPRYVVSAVLVDDNAGSLYNSEIITHNISLSNSGTSTGTNVQVVLTYASWFTFNSGSIVFMTGTHVNTGSVVVDETLRTISFTIPVMTGGTLDTLKFKTTATGPVGSINKTNVTLTSEEWPGATWVSNELIIVAKPSGWGWWGTPSKDSCPNGDYSGSYYDKSCGTKPTETPKTETPVETPKTEKPKNETPKQDTPKTPVVKKDENNDDIIKEIDDLYKDYQNKKKRLDEIYAQETKQGEVSFEKLPKVLPKTGTPIGQRIKTQHNNLLNVSVDVSQLKLAGNYNTDINYWKDALPEIDKNASEIIVTPSNGMVIPVVNVPNFEKDYSELISGREIDVNKYLKNGALKYPGTGDNGYGTTGNPVIFWHSSYFKKDNGRYKTLFQEIISLDAGEPIWVYKKLDDGSYKRYVYIVETSYEINPSKVDILNAGIWRNLTLFTCTPIGNLTGRWVVTAKYFDEEKIALENELFGKSVPKKHKNLFNGFIKKFASVDKTKQAKIIIWVFRVLNTDNAKKIFSENSIKYFKLLLVQKFIQQ